MDTMANGLTHSFDVCPLRSSSALFIVRHTDQSIITVTDQVLHLLGHSPSDFIGTSINRLLTQTAATSWSARDIHGHSIALQVCIHHDPLHTTTGQLDYWLVRRLDQPCLAPPPPKHHRYPFTIQDTTVLLLSQYGIIDRVYDVKKDAHTLQPAANQSLLVGKPVMAYIHNDDIQGLCGQLSTVFKAKEPRIDVRWLSQEKEWQWIAITAAKAGSRITCVIEPIRPASRHNAIQQWAFEWLELAMEQYKLGKAYLCEFVDHVPAAMVSKYDPAWFSAIEQVVKGLYTVDVLLYAALEDWVDRLKAARPSFF
ncbi:hypothetical protein BX666DRAFT_1206461 [Dichotomocladium elegans]|nr:hypothetical protein BX666DRAFT_1206461 [Dichotomocladium elegans]